MLDINEFMDKYYGFNPERMLSLEEWEDYKVANGIEEWDYPLEEYDHITDLKLKCVPVRFVDGCGRYDYRFCELPEEN